MRSAVCLQQSICEKICSGARVSTHTPCTQTHPRRFTDLPQIASLTNCYCPTHIPFIYPAMCPVSLHASLHPFFFSPLR